MQNNRVGNSGLYVSPLSLGSMLFAEGTDRQTPEAEAKALVNTFLDSGCNHIDTANVYAGGEAERIIGEALEGRNRTSYSLASKVRFNTERDPHLYSGLSRPMIMLQVEQSLQRLKTDYLDLYYMHGWDPNTPLEESLNTIEQVVHQGKVRYVGISNFRAWQLVQAQLSNQFKQRVLFTAAQYQYSLVERSIEWEYNSLFAAHNLSLFAWGPLGGGFLTGKYRRDEKPSEGRIATTPDNLEEAWKNRATEQNWQLLALMEDIASTHKATVSQVALAWVIAQPQVCSAIIGPRTSEQLADNLGALTLNLSKEEISQLSEVSQPAKPYPYRMIEAFGME